MTIFADLVQKGGYYLEGGLNEFAAWSKKMVEDLGEGIRPYLDDGWTMTNLAKHDLTREGRISKARTTRLGKHLAELEARLDLGDFTKEPRPAPVPYDKETQKLKDRVDELAKQFKAVEGAKPTPEQANRIAALAKAASETREKMEAGPRRVSGGKSTAE
jgi:hypothetical protein